MFEVGNYVIYGTTGVCQICEIAPLPFGQEGLYYTLRIVHDSQNNFIYAPITSVATGKVFLRDMISPAQAENFLQSLPSEPLPWIPDLRKRNENYTLLAASGDPCNWARLLVCLYTKQKEKQEEQRTLPRRDHELLALSEKLLYGELATVLDRSMEDIKQQFLRLLDRMETHIRSF